MQTIEENIWKQRGQFKRMNVETRKLRKGQQEQADTAEEKHTVQTQEKSLN